MVPPIMPARELLCVALVATLSGCGTSDEPHYAVPFKALDDYLGQFDGKSYAPVFLRGVNLGVALPGSNPGDLPATRDDYDRWLDHIREIGMNCIRVYSLHSPRFYEALRDHNREHQGHPLYVLHGVHLDENGSSGDLDPLASDFDTSVRQVVDAVHGSVDVAERLGNAWGTYDADISPWVVGWILGREVAPSEVLTTNAAHADRASYEGDNLRLTGNATETWWAERLDHVIGYERQAYGAERPVSVASWPPLDPLEHVTEGPPSQEDVATVDMAQLEALRAPAGFFVSYHAYPNHPDFMTDQPDYQSASDDLGLNSYLGYLRDLKSHYGKMPVMVAEFGISTSVGIAHTAPSGMHDGGHDEVTQGLYVARMLRDINGERMAGAVGFAWIDEWGRPTWITQPLAFPSSSYPFWHNVMSPEANYGLITLCQKG
jgi:hypothetical protein